MEKQIQFSQSKFTIYHMVSHTLAEDPASAKDPLKPFFLTKPEPERCVHTRHLFITVTNTPRRAKNDWFIVTPAHLNH